MKMRKKSEIKKLCEALLEEDDDRFLSPVEAGILGALEWVLEEKVTANYMDDDDDEILYIACLFDKQHKGKLTGIG